MRKHARKTAKQVRRRASPQLVAAACKLQEFLRARKSDALHATWHEVVAGAKHMAARCRRDEARNHAYATQAAAQHTRLLPCWVDNAISSIETRSFAAPLATILTTAAMGTCTAGHTLCVRLRGAGTFGK